MIRADHLINIQEAGNRGGLLLLDLLFLTSAPFFLPTAARPPSHRIWHTRFAGATAGNLKCRKYRPSALA